MKDTQASEAIWTTVFCWIALFILFWIGKHIAPTLPSLGKIFP